MARLISLNCIHIVLLFIFAVKYIAMYNEKMNEIVVRILFVSEAKNGI